MKSVWLLLIVGFLYFARRRCRVAISSLAVLVAIVVVVASTTTAMGAPALAMPCSSSAFQTERYRYGAGDHIVAPAPKAVSRAALTGHVLGTACHGATDTVRTYGYDYSSTSTNRVSTVATNTGSVAGEVGETSIHGAERVAGPAATRGGVLSSAEIAEVRSGAQQVFSQSNGATAKVFQQADGRFSVVVDGDRGFMTSFKNLSQGSLDRLAKNYGWKPK
jgi:hypothetical protein